MSESHAQRDHHHHHILRGVVGLIAAGVTVIEPVERTRRLGVFMQPTRDLHRVYRQPTVMKLVPNTTLYELARWCRMVLRGHTDAIELLWLPIDMYDVRKSLGDELISLRGAFSCRENVRNSYINRAMDQLQTLEVLAAEPIRQSVLMAECARELLLLCWQGYTFYATGELTVRVDDPLRFKAFGQRVAGGHVDDARKVIAQYNELFERTRSPLPIAPDVNVIDAWLHNARRKLMDNEKCDDTR